MNDNSLIIAFTVDRTPDQAFAAIANLRGWWSGEIDGVTDELGAEFTYRYHDVHRSTQRITELIPGRRVTWHVSDAYLNFVDDATEWTWHFYIATPLRRLISDGSGQPNPNEDGAS